MADVFWTGEIAFMKRIILNINGMIAWILGNMKDTETMKDDIKIAYNGERTSDVENYDVFGWNHYAKVADMLLEDIIIQGKDVLDVGCGTGISIFYFLYLRSSFSIWRMVADRRDCILCGRHVCFCNGLCSDLDQRSSEIDGRNENEKDKIKEGFKHEEIRII